MTPAPHAALERGSLVREDDGTTYADVAIAWVNRGTARRADWVGYGQVDGVARDGNHVLTRVDGVRRRCVAAASCALDRGEPLSSVVLYELE